MMNKFLLALLMSVLAVLRTADASSPEGPKVIEQDKAIALEKRSYIKNMKLLARHFPDTDRWGKMQMMAVGEKRYLLQAYSLETPEGHRTRGVIIDVTDPIKPVVVNDNAWAEEPHPGAFQIQVGYNQELQKWILIAGASAFSQTVKGLRGIRIYDITNPVQTQLLSEWSVDGGDPRRALQTGSGPHRFWYDGGKYAYLSAAPDNNFFFPEYKGQRVPWTYSWGLQVLDVSNPETPKFVTNQHIAGQRYDELEARQKWVFADDPVPMPFQHGPIYVPKRVEDGGQYGFGSWGSFGMIIHDFSDPQNPNIFSRWTPDPSKGPQIAVHTVDIAQLGEGLVITNPEAIMSQCKETQVPISIVDVTDLEKPKLVANLPLPQPPEEAPYHSFCERYGRFGPHNPPHVKAPGRADPNFTCYAFFNAGLQCYDIGDRKNPKISGYFIPSQGTESAEAEIDPGPSGAWIRTVDNVFIEWDRRLIWVASDSALYLLSAPELGEPILTPMAVEEWVLPELNEGHP